MSHATTQLGLNRLLSEGTWLRALARSLLHNGPDADDATQEVWMAALRSPPDEGRPPQPWLAQVLRNVIRSSARRTRAERVREKAEGALREQQAPPAEGVLQRMETQRVVAEQVMALAEPYRSTLLLRFYEGRPAADIARAQGIPAGTVRWRNQRGFASASRANSIKNPADSARAGLAHSPHGRACLLPARL